MQELRHFERSSRRVAFPGIMGQTLAGILDTPRASPLGTVLFSHCFTCNKDLKAIVRISRRLAELGIAVLRYDWTGLGDSQGKFSETTFSTGINDLKSAAAFLRAEVGGPQILLGYSLGGAASLAAAEEIDAVEGVVTIGAPCDTQHLAYLLEHLDPQIAAHHCGQVVIGGIRWSIEQALVEDLRTFDLKSRLERFQLPVLLVHSYADETVKYSHALRLMSQLTSSLERPPPPISILSLPQADHLLTRNPQDLEWISQSIVRWIFGLHGSRASVR